MNIGSGHYQISGDEGNQARQQKSHQRDKQLGSLSHKIVRIILKMDKGDTQTNKLKDKKSDDDVQKD